tara:strand:+ start:350 stop:496 length:147 start_codon:yes stop_codon:yes gene_type:complete
MFKVKENDVFAKNMSQQELYKMWKKMKARREMDEFLKKLTIKNGTTKI